MKEEVVEFDMLDLWPLFGTDDQPHWLTKMLLMQILGNDTPMGQVAAAQAVAAAGNSHLASPGHKSEDGFPQPSCSHSRSEVISAWVRVGELCCIASDECSWRAIMAAICSKPVTRLDKVWKRVDMQAVGMVELWVYPRPQPSP
jgi:GTPase-activating protein BEM2